MLLGSWFQRAIVSTYLGMVDHKKKFQGQKTMFLIFLLQTVANAVGKLMKNTRPYSFDVNKKGFP